MQPEPEPGQPFAVVTLNTTGSTAPESTAHTRAWIIPPGIAEAFARAMTERFGEQVLEQIGTNGIFAKHAAAAAAEGVVFLTDAG